MTLVSFTATGSSLLSQLINNESKQRLIKDSRTKNSISSRYVQVMKIMDQIHRLRLECIGGTCSIDESDCEASGS